jgi:hypothetical protein
MPEYCQSALLCYIDRTRTAYLSHTCALVSVEAAIYAIGSGTNVGQAVSVDFFGVGAHAGYGEDLLVLLHSLLELAKEDAETCGG